jgi:ribonuclease VapC
VIVVDTSAVVAIIRQEHDGNKFTDILDAVDGAIISAVSFVETNMVIAGRRADPDIDQLRAGIRALGIEVAEVTLDQADVAVRAFLQYGKGRHPARLNIADCFAYALAKSRNLPLLFKGDDFAKTDVIPAWRP